MHSFKSSLAKGKAGESALLELWPELQIIPGGRKGDFMLGDNKVELKSDSYDMNDTPNMFIERYSNVDKGTPGSVWQALTHECSIFVYWYPKNKTAFVFDTVILKNVLDTIIHEMKPKPINIYNHRWVSVGFKINRELLLPYAEVKQW